MTRKIFVSLLCVCVLGCLVGCANNEKPSGLGGIVLPEEKPVAKSNAVIIGLNVSRIYEQPIDNNLVHISLSGQIGNVEKNCQGLFTIETAFCLINGSQEIPGSGEISHIYVGSVNSQIALIDSTSPTEVYFREFNCTEYESINVQKMAGQKFQLIVYLKQVINAATNERLTLQRIPTSFVFTASPLQPYQIQK